jgi:hypothetical protein
LVLVTDYEEQFMIKPTTVPTFATPRTFWSQHRESSLNWLALGLLLAAWNSSDDGTSQSARRRPDSLRGYAYVSVRAAQRSVEISQ